MVFQSYALYPHMNVYDNLAFGLKLRKIDKKEIDRRVKEAAETIQLTTLLERKPKELSGGQRQRVALGRAIVREPAVFLMDEPLSNLDAKLRVQTRAEIARLHQRLKTTIVYVTHDQVEAMTMGQRIAVMSQAKLQQVGSPQELYDRPINKFVAGFIGSPAMNFLPDDPRGVRRERDAQVRGRRDPGRRGLPRGDRGDDGPRLHRRGPPGALGRRADRHRRSPPSRPRPTSWSTSATRSSSTSRWPGQDLVAIVSSERRVRPGDVVTLHIPLDKMHLFDAETELSVRRTAVS